MGHVQIFMWNLLTFLGHGFIWYLEKHWAGQTKYICPGCGTQIILLWPLLQTLACLPFALAMAWFQPPSGCSCQGITHSLGGHFIERAVRLTLTSKWSDVESRQASVWLLSLCITACLKCFCQVLVLGGLICFHNFSRKEMLDGRIFFNYWKSKYDKRPAFYYALTLKPVCLHVRVSLLDLALILIRWPQFNLKLDSFPLLYSNKLVD